MKYPEDFINKIICGDCLDVMKEMPDGCVDLVITSPPYNRGANNMTPNKYLEFSDDLPEKEYYLWTASILSELLRITKKHIFYIIQMLAANKLTILKILNDFQDNFKDIIIWNKSMVPPQIEPGVMNNKFEFVIIFSNQKPHLRKFDGVNFCGNFNNVIEGRNASDNLHARHHRAVFPNYLIETIIKNFSIPYNIILDPMIGSGTTAESCLLSNRNFIGIEINPEYCKIAGERLAQGVL